MNDRNHVARRTREAGFTLIELLVAIAILGILGTIVIKSVWGNVDEAKQVSTKAKLDQLDNQVQMYRRKHNELPRWPDDMLAPDPMKNNEAWLSEEDILDAWGRRIELKEGERANEFFLVSYGQNGEEDGFGAEFGYDRDLSSKLPLDATTEGQ